MFFSARKVCLFGNAEVSLRDILRREDCDDDMLRSTAILDF